MFSIPSFPRRLGNRRNAENRKQKAESRKRTKTAKNQRKPAERGGGPRRHRGAVPYCCGLGVSRCVLLLSPPPWRERKTGTDELRGTSCCNLVLLPSIFFTLSLSLSYLSHVSLGSFFFLLSCYTQISRRFSLCLFSLFFSPWLLLLPLFPRFFPLPLPLPVILRPPRPFFLFGANPA